LPGIFLGPSSIDDGLFLSIDLDEYVIGSSGRLPYDRQTRLPLVAGIYF
jgi:hypothetical protein